jgi:alpha-glucosidase
MGQGSRSGDLFERIRFRGEPAAHPEAMVREGNARFTVLTPRLLRMEWSAVGAFEDRSTFAFPTRSADPTPFDVRRSAGWLAVDTGPLLLRYNAAQGRFGDDSLSVSLDLNGERAQWCPGLVDPWNLRGTRRTVDRCAGDASLGPGIVSRSGWALHDDSTSVVFDDHDGWVAPRPDHELQDWYFFGYGHDYKLALRDYLRFGGGVPLIPRYVLGLWWSRYWAYSDQELRDLVGEFESHGIPLDVLVVDMDWHLPDTWTGYTWNRDLFPDPQGFLRWVRAKGLRVTFNLHPAQGVQRHEAMYEAFANAVGADTADGQPVPFRIANRRFVDAYFRLLHHPMEDDGVDFWWVDWQQGESSEMKGLDPLPWLNHLHFNDSTRRGNRPMLYSRWGGLGNHRYHIGFSGDTFVVWPALQFQPYLTATASNVAYGWWSHDIGGHMGGATDPELYARWVQFGALSPCLRLHSTKDPRAERRPWAFPDAVYRAAAGAIALRYRLTPYIYTMARVASDTGVSLCRPMYYEYADEEAAYTARYQYFFGDDMIAAPIVFPIDAETGMACTDVWVPPGSWVEFTTKEAFTGPRWVRIVGDLQRLPLLVRAGAIIPMSAGFEEPAEPGLASGCTGTQQTSTLELAVFPGAAGAFRLYEDDGLTREYSADAAEWTEMRSEMADLCVLAVDVMPVEGRCAVLPATRGYRINFVGVRRPDKVMVDGAPVDDWSYDSASLTACVRVPARAKGRRLTVAVHAADGISAVGEGLNSEIVAQDVRHLLDGSCPGNPLDVDAILGCQSAGRLDAIARLGGPFVRCVEYVTPEESSRTLGRVIVGAPADGLGQYCVEARFALQGPDGHETRTLRRDDAAGPLILDVPFAYDGVVRPLQWEVEVSIRWRGHVLTFEHASQPHFPSVYAWRCSVWQPTEDGEFVRCAPDRTFEQDGASLDQSVLEPYVVDLRRSFADLLPEHTTLHAWLETRVRSPLDQDAVIRFIGQGDVEIELNGEIIEEALLDTPETDPPPFYQATRTTGRVRLREGYNHLRIRAEQGSSLHGPLWWCGAAFAGMDGLLIGGLAWEATPGVAGAHG